MALVSKPGRYIARPTSWTIKQEEGKCPRFAMVFECDQEQAEGQFQPMPVAETITGYFTLFNKDGSPNEINLRALNEALGWDGSSLTTLESGEWADKEVQIVVENREYNGKTGPEVKYLNPRDYAPRGMEKADPQQVKSLDQKYGPQLRALFNKKPAGTNSQKPAAAAIAAPDPVEAAKHKAWQAFIGATPEYDAEKRKVTFKGVVGECFPGQDPKIFAADKWEGIAKAIETSFSPATGSLIPF